VGGTHGRRRSREAVTLAEAPDVLTVVECARLARTGPKPIYRAIASGELYGRRIGKQIRVPKRAFIACYVNSAIMWSELLGAPCSNQRRVPPSWSAFT